LYTSPLGDLRKSIDEITSYQDQALARMTKLISKNHPYYVEKYAQLGIDVSKVDSIAKLENLPVTEKAELISNPLRFRLNPEKDSTDEYVVWDIVYTAGTSSSPTPIYQTSYDFRGILLAQVRMAEIRGMSNKSRIMNLYPITTHPHGAWLRANNAAAALGCAITSGMSGRDFGSFELTRKTSEIIDLTIHNNSLGGTFVYPRSSHSN
jgi:phenylacetate-coenzyme A ligase PaaK-like adenylate-forming protein